MYMILLHKGGVSDAVRARCMRGARAVRILPHDNMKLSFHPQLHVMRQLTASNFGQRSPGTRWIVVASFISAQAPRTHC